MVLARQGTPAPMTRQSKKENDYVCSSPNNRLGLAQQPPGYPGMVVFVVFDENPLLRQHQCRLQVKHPLAQFV
jgi:hypothetical protein